jgi:hypothetical protein
MNSGQFHPFVITRAPAGHAARIFWDGKETGLMKPELLHDRDTPRYQGPAENMAVTNGFMHPTFKFHP